MLKDLDEALQSNPEISERPSYFQLKHFVIGKEPTVQGQMWQCLREIRTHRDSLKGLLTERAELKDRIKIQKLHVEKVRAKTEIQCEGQEDDLDYTKLRIEIRKLRSLKDSLTQTGRKIRFVREQARFFLEQLNLLRQREPMLPFDDEKAQIEYWTASLLREIELKLLMRQPVPCEVVKMALSLDDDSPLKKEVRGMLERSHRELTASDQGHLSAEG